MRRALCAGSGPRLPCQAARIELRMVVSDSEDERQGHWVTNVMCVQVAARQQGAGCCCTPYVPKKQQMADEAMPCCCAHLQPILRKSCCGKTQDKHAVQCMTAMHRLGLYQLTGSRHSYGRTTAACLKLVCFNTLLLTKSRVRRAVVLLLACRQPSYVYAPTSRRTWYDSWNTVKVGMCNRTTARRSGVLLVMKVPDL